ncbi:MAG: flagellar biosynthetic protein FliR [Kiritimatiellae bacterium]|nr:flagellar biosynthetic protein FliR [Kiritimatiellia bacterium]
MEIQLAFYPQALLLVIARVASITWGTVVFGKDLAPLEVRVLLAFAIAMVITPLAPEAWARTAMAMNDLPRMTMGLLGEALLGFSIALICELFVGIFSMTGYVLGWASSLTMSQEIDPVSGVQNNVLGILMQLVFLMIIWTYGGHLMLIEIVVKSLQTVPPTFAWLDGQVTEMMVALGGLMFEWGVKLGAPVIGAAMILNAAMGLVAKMAPQFNILFLSLPIRLGTGMLMMGFFLRYGGGHFREIVMTMLEYCLKLVL